MPPALEARSLSLVRDGTTVLNDVSFAVAPGEVYALLGGNGAGKSTTLLTFLGFLAPSGGEVLVAGRPVTQDVEAARTRVDGVEVVQVRITARLPLLGTLGPTALTVEGHAMAERL